MYKSSGQLTHRNLRLFPWFNLLMALRLYGPVAILYFTDVAGSFALGMSVFSLVTISQSIFEIPTGIFSDLIGRRSTLILGTLVTLSAVTAYAVGGSYAALLVGACLEGLANALFSGNNAALLHDTLSESGAPAAYADTQGRFTAVLHIGFGLAAVAGGLIGSYALPATYWISLVPLTLAAMLSFFFVYTRRRASNDSNAFAHFRSAVHKTVTNQRLRTLSLAAILTHAIGESMWIFRAQFLRQVWPTWALGFSQLLADAGAALGYFFAGRLIRRFGELRLLVGGTALSELCNLIALLIPTRASPVIMSMTSLFFGSNNTAMSALMQREFSDEQRATMGSITSLSSSIAFSIAAVLLGALADRIGPTAALVVATIAMAAPMLFNWMALRKRS
jgi:MFS family permease